MRYGLLCSAVLLSAPVAAADFNFNGFGSITAATLIDGSGYIADYPNLGVYEKDFDFGQETRLGLQGKAIIDDKLSATMQIMSRAANDYEAQVEWLYATYNLTSDTNLQAGRMRMPVYYFSDYMDVGYAYPWLRIPADTYSLDVTNFNGVKLNSTFKTGDVYYRLSLYGGNESNPSDELMSYLFESFTTNIDREFENILGAALDMTWGGLSVRGTYTQAAMEETQTYGDGSMGVIDFDIKFYDLFAKYEFDSGFALMAEYNKYEPFYKSYFGSATYQTGALTYYVSWSQFDLDTPFEKHDTTSLGARWDLGDTYALKFDVSSMTDEGFNPFTNQPNPVYHDATNGDGDVTIFSVALDFVF